MVVRKLHKGDFGFNLDFALVDADGAAIDLTNATLVTFKMMRRDKGVTVKITGTCTKNTPNTLGTVFYPVVSGDLDEEGEFDYQIQVTEASSLITAESQDTISVLRRF